MGEVVPLFPKDRRKRRRIPPPPLQKVRVVQIFEIPYGKSGEEYLTERLATFLMQTEPDDDVRVKYLNPNEEGEA